MNKHKWHMVFMIGSMFKKKKTDVPIKLSSSEKYITKQN